MSSSSSIASKVLLKLQRRNDREVAPFAALVEMSTRLAISNGQLAGERDQLEYINSKLKEENQRLLKTTSEPDHEQVATLERKLFALQEELTELHRRRGENAQQIIDQTAQLKDNDIRIAKLDSLVKDTQAKLHAADLEIASLKSMLTDLEATNQLLNDEYQTLQLVLTSTEGKLVQAQKENNTLLAQVMEFKDRDVRILNSENEKAMRLQQERIKQQLEEAVAEPKTVAPIRAFSFFRSAATLPELARESLESAFCHSVRIPNRCYLKYEAHEGEVNAIKWSPQGCSLLTAGSDRKIKIWDISKNVAEQRGVLAGSNGAVMSLDYDSSGALVLAASADYASRVWSIDDQRVRHTLTGHSGKVLSAKFMTDSNKVVSASYDRTIKVWDLRSKACVATKFPGSSCDDIVCSENSMISGHFDKKIRFWDIRSGTEPVEELELGGKVTSLDLSRNGLSLLACCRDDSLRLIDPRTCSLVRTFTTDGFQVGCDWSRATISPDSEYVTAGSANGKVFIWSIHNASVVEKVLVEHTAPVIAVDWQPAGNSLTTCDKNRTVIVWAAIG